MGAIRRRSAVAFSLWLATLLALLLGASPTEASSGSEHIRVGVEVLDFDPLVDGGQPLTVARGWNDPVTLHPQYISDIAKASGGIVEQQVVHVTVVRDYPVKADGFHFTNETYQSCFVDARPDYCKELIDYEAVLNTAFDPGGKSACDALRTGRIDEIWLWGGPWFGYLEWHLVTAQSLCPAVRKPFAVMGFSYERGEPEMLHDLGHRAEGLVQAGIGLPLWDRFDGQRDRYAQDFACPAQPDAGHPEVAGVVVHAGNVHFPPNAYCHYQYDRDFAVTSDADDWANFPHLTGATTVINFTTWSGTQQGFIVWWLGRFPRHRGSSAGAELDWWRYVYFATR